METYVVRYAVLPATRIINYVGPKSEEQVAIYNNRNGFFAKLEESIKKEGIRNPIIVTAGWVPGPIRKNLDMPMEETKITAICWQVGGSRLYTANKLGIDVPCIIKDHSNVFPDAQLLNDASDVADCFTDQPEAIFLENNVLKIHWRTVKV